jgi:uncharacterized tellurite resistance protein B-like protein
MSAVHIEKLSLEERIAYATVVGSMAAADDVVTREEIERLKELCRKLKLSDEDANKVLDGAQSHDARGADAALARLRESDLRFTLYADCATIAYADDALVESEKHALHEIAAELGISDEQAEALREYAEATHAAARADSGHAAAVRPVPAHAEHDEEVAVLRGRRLPRQAARRDPQRVQHSRARLTSPRVTSSRVASFSVCSAMPASCPRRRP